jgi:hypothetical protein
MKVQNTYRIRHRDIESTPHTISDLRQMWKAGQIDATTEFRRGDSAVWLDANDLLPELEFNEAAALAPAPGSAMTATGSPISRNPAPAGSGSLRITSVRVPFREIFVLVFKIYAAAVVLATLAAAAWVLILRLTR